MRRSMRCGCRKDSDAALKAEICMCACSYIACIAASAKVSCWVGARDYHQPKKAPSLALFVLFNQAKTLHWTLGQHSALKICMSTASSHGCQEEHCPP